MRGIGEVRGWGDGDVDGGGWTGVNRTGVVIARWQQRVAWGQSGGGGLADVCNHECVGGESDAFSGSIGCGDKMTIELKS